MTSRGRPASRQDLARSDGLTILELLIALTLLAVVVGGLYRFVATGSQSARLTNNFLQIQAQARAALDNVVDEIRWGQQVTAAGPTSVTVLVPQATPFSAASPYIVTFAYAAAADAVTRQEDPDAGGPLPAGPAEPVAYFIVLKDGSNGLALEYFDDGGNALGAAPADPSVIARVHITLTATLNQTSRTLIGDTALRGR